VDSLRLTPHTFFPFLEWFNGYQPGHLKRDTIAGLTVALVLIPQSMAYAQLAGLPPFYGLYAAFLPPVVASLFGSSRQLATGPVAVVSLMTAVALEPLAVMGGEQFIAYAILLALLVGMFQFALGLLRLGMLVNFLSHPVVNGFTNAAAIIIATSQLSKMFGVHVDKSDQHYETVITVVKAAVHYTHWPTLALGVLAFVVMLTLKKISPRIPGVLVAVVTTTLISWGFGFEHSTTVSFSEIDWPEARSLVSQFNTDVGKIDHLAKERSVLRSQVAEAQADGDRIAVVNIVRDVDIVEIRIEDVSARVRNLRHRIRRLLFEGGMSEDGRLRLFEAGEVPDSLKSDGRVWRLKVAGRPLDLDRITVAAGGEVVGKVPGGLPRFAIPGMEEGVVLYLMPFAFIISLLGFMEAISIAKAMAAKTGQRIDPNQELIGQGLANIVGSIAGSFPTSGSFSRSAVNLQSGAVSGLSGVFTGVAVVVVLLFFTPLLYYLPQSVLAAIIMIAVVGLINLKGVLHAWRAQWYDGVISVITFIATLVLAPHLDRGILIGAALSICVFLYKSMRPTVVDLSLGLDRTLHDSVAYGLEECRYIDVVRFDGPLFFANAGYLEDQIRERRITKKELKHIIIVSNGINDIDASGEEALSLTVDRVRRAGIGISLSGINESVAETLRRTHLLAKIGRDNIFPNLSAAIDAVHEPTHKGASERECPLTTCVVLPECAIAEEK
jgi:sulfate permease, SulP family